MSMIDLLRTSVLPPIFGEDEPISHVGFAMALRQIDFIPIVKDGNLVGRLCGKEILLALNKTRKAGFGILETMRAKEVLSSDVGQVGLNDSLAKLLETMNQTRFGHVCVLDRGKIKGTVSLRDLIEYASKLNLKTGIAVSELASSAKTLSSEKTIAELIEFLLREQTRRILATPPNLNKATVDDRLIIQHAFWDEKLLTNPHSADEFFHRPVSSLHPLDCGSIRGDADLTEAWRIMYRNPAECLVIEGENSILTPWDAVIKPFKSGVFPVQPVHHNRLTAKAALSALGALVEKLRRNS